ncbi:hypothetical protein F183_A13770 [Bryobacterales bacterium F-183]|nr:hypothetical protein F183_A13770 [Bryobacterales bacterium F-183]
MVLRILLLVMLVPASAVYGWDRAQALRFLEQRQAEWTAWKPAQNKAGSCLSCHTGVPYLLARKAMGAAVDGEPLVRATVQRMEAKPAMAMGFDAGAEAVLNVWALSLRKDRGGEAGKAALRRLWELQIADGAEKGSWTWVLAGLEPWDSPTANYFGAALAQQALRGYANLPGDRVAALRGYLKAKAKDQPLHNRLAWVALGDWPGAERVRVLQELWGVQEADGGFRTEALGPWMERKDAPADRGSNAYATAWVAYAALEAGVGCKDARMQRVLGWLERNQDAGTGAWKAVSMNRVHEPGSITAGFMTDAATGFAVAALSRCGG